MKTRYKLVAVHNEQETRKKGGIGVKEKYVQERRWANPQLLRSAG
jgi:hypothetical protein